MDLHLKERVVLITGAANGIGLACAKAFLHEGAKVIIVDMQEISDASVASKAEFYCASVTDTLEMNNIINTLQSKYNKIDVLVNNAGISSNNVTSAFKDEEIDRAFDINVKSVIKVSRQYFKTHRRLGGNIINLASILAIIGAPLGVLYGATKGAVLSMTRSMAVEFAKSNFRVNAICPGLVETAMTERVRKNKNMLDANLAMIPMKRFARADEIANVCLFLASDVSSYITGQGIVVDGGYTIK